MAQRTPIHRIVALRGGVSANVSSAEGIDSIIFSAKPHAWAILLIGLLGRDDFEALLASFSGRFVSCGLDCEACEVESHYTDDFLREVNVLIEKHFPGHGACPAAA